MLLLVVTGAGKIFYQKYQIKKEIAELEARAEKISRANTELSALIEYLDTPEYAERQAREKLNLKKEGEIVVAAPRETDADKETEPELAEKSNAQKWYDYFFGE